MGWYATAQALKSGHGAYGTVKESLKGETDWIRTLSVALHQIKQEIAAGIYIPDKQAKIRIAHWSKRK